MKNTPLDHSLILAMHSVHKSQDVRALARCIARRRQQEPRWEVRVVMSVLDGIGK